MHQIKSEEDLNKVASEHLEKYKDKEWIVFCPFCKTELIQEDNHSLCPKCRARYSITLYSDPIILGSKQ